jgi:ubiquinone/menaquinone biosynthesis C-methylase UbiE/uncharacterized protein YbaR (Trm112 family)
MKEAALNLLCCPDCAGHLDYSEESRKDGELVAGRFRCANCSTVFELENGIPMFVPGDLSKEVDQIKSSYGAKWNRAPGIYDDDSEGTKHQHEWYLTRYHFASENDLRTFMSDKRSILDAGCGLGRDVRRYAALQPEATVIGADLSEGAKHAYQKSKTYRNASIIRADLNKLPFSPETFDFVACDQVLPVVPDAKASVKKLWSLVKPGGHFAFYLYKKKSPIREFSDDYLRNIIDKMTPEEGWAASENITRLGKALSDLKVEFDVPSDIPELEIKAGRYDIQRFFFYHVLKCFWRDGMTFDENVLVNFDWFHPAYTFRHTVEEVEGWTRELGMNVLVLDREDLSGISVLAEKPA